MSSLRHCSASAAAMRAAYSSRSRRKASSTRGAARSWSARRPALTRLTVQRRREDAFRGGAARGLPDGGGEQQFGAGLIGASSTFTRPVGPRNTPNPREFPEKIQSTKSERTHCFLAIFAYIALQTRRVPGRYGRASFLGVTGPVFHVSALSEKRSRLDRRDRA